MHSIFLHLPSSQIRCLEVDNGCLVVDVKRKVGVEDVDCFVIGGGSVLQDSMVCPDIAHVNIRVRGGKGGFGTLLRNTTPGLGQQKNRDFGAMRDLHGRRIRDVEAEAEKKTHEDSVKEYQEKHRKRQREEAHQRLNEKKALADRNMSLWHEKASESLEGVEQALAGALKNKKIRKTAADKAKHRKSKGKKKIVDDGDEKSMKSGDDDLIDSMLKDLGENPL